MPKYDYRCDECGTVCEVSHGFSEDPVVVCECGGGCGRVIGVPRVQPSATPSQRGGGKVWFDNYAEKRLVKDRDAYQRAKRDGHQPVSLRGQAVREARADTLVDYVGEAV